VIQDILDFLPAIVILRGFEFWFKFLCKVTQNLASLKDD